MATNAEIALKTTSLIDFYKKMNFCPTYFESAVEHFYKDVHKYETRSNSWAQCYRHFVELKRNYDKTKSISPKEIDEACVRLGFYMASWGMYRGSSFLLQNDYKIYKYIVKKIITDHYYDVLWNLDGTIIRSATDNDFIKATFDPLKKLIAKVTKILQPYKHHYITKSWYANHSKKQKKCSISKTLVTKLILGAIGCYPAIDSFFSEAIGAVANDLSDDQIKCMLRLAYYVKKHHVGFTSKCKKTGDLALSRYPVMKLIDMYYFTLGMEKPFLKLISDLLAGKAISALDNKEKKLLKQFIIYNKVTKKPEVNISYPCYPINKKATPCTCTYLTLGKNKYDDIIDDLTDIEGKLYKEIAKIKVDEEE